MRGFATLLFFVGQSVASSAQWSFTEPNPLLEAYTDFTGEGMSLVDFNQDGWDDLTMTDPGGQFKFYQGGPEGWTEVDLGIVKGTGRPTSMMWLDIDNDGDRDFVHTAAMVLSYTTGTGQLSAGQIWIKENDGYVNRTSEWGWDVLQNRACTGMSFADMDLDGKLDAMVPVYALPCQNTWLSENVLLHQGDNLFEDVSQSAGIASGMQPSFQGAWLHLNDDLLLDLVVINDYGVEWCSAGDAIVNQAYMNNGDGTFTESGAALGLDVSMSSMCLTIGDPDADGEEELFVSNQDTDDPNYESEQLTGAFFDRNDSGSFDERSAELGLNTQRWAWGSMWVDYNSDGWEDLMVSTSPFVIAGSTYPEFDDNYLFQHPGAGLGENTPFVDMLEDWEGSNVLLYTIARGDLDGDLRPDVVGVGPGQFAEFWTNQSGTEQADHHALTVGVCGSWSNSEAIGTRMVLHAGGHPQMRTLRAGEDLYVQHSATQFFGLGTAQTADSLELFWPNGDRTVVYDLVADSAYQFVEQQEDIGISLGQTLSGDSVELLLSAPPKWTSLTMNGQPVDSTVVVVLNGQETSFEWSWLNGLFSVTRDVDWSALDSNEQGCTVSIADNYNPQAVTDDGSCTYHGLCGEGTAWSVALQQCVLANASCSEDVTGDGVVGVEDILELLGMFGEACAPD